jgi:hypothetical protein
MAILDKLAFWKKKDEFDLGDLGPMPGEEKDKGMPSATPSPFEKEMGTEPSGFPEEPSTHPSPAAGVPEEPSGPDFSAPPGGPAPTHPAAAQMPSPASGNRDIELISAKLDAIKAMLENINQRLATLERIAKSSSEHETYPRY